MLHSAHYAMIFFESGLLQLWDMKSAGPDGEKSRTPHVCDVVSDDKHDPQRIGSLVACHSIVAAPVEYDYETKYAGDATYVVLSSVR